MGLGFEPTDDSLRLKIESAWIRPWTADLPTYEPMGSQHIGNFFVVQYYPYMETLVATSDPGRIMEAFRQSPKGASLCG